MKHLLPALIALNGLIAQGQVDWDLQFSDDVMNVAFGEEYDFLTTRTSVFRSVAGMNEWIECNWTLGIVRDGTSVLNGLSWNNERLVVAALDNGYFMSEDLGESFVQTGPTGFGCGSESILHLDEGELIATMGGFQRGLWKCGQSPSTNWSRNYSVGADQRDIQQVGEDLFAVSHSGNHPGGILQSFDYGGSWQLVFGTQYSGNPSSYVILENTLIFISWDGVVHHIDMTDWSELTSFSSAIVSPSDMLEVEGVLFLTSWDGGVYRSEDLGQSWEDIGPNNSSFYKLVLQGDELFAAGETGLWTLSAPGFSSGCTDPLSCNYNANVVEDDGSCLPYDAPVGCMDETACNFDAIALCHDSSCIYPLIAGDCQSGSVACAEGTNWNVTLQQCVPVESPGPCGPGTYWDEVNEECAVLMPSDADFDGCVGMTDLLDLLSTFGTCVEIPWTCGATLEYQGYDYETVKIGGQCWFAENLRAEFYLNGEAIPTGLSDTLWSSASQGAFAKNPTPEYAWQGASAYDIGGPLYNWFAVDEVRGICPSGWHVPDDMEWEELAMSLGGSSEAGQKMKAVEGWNPDCYFASVAPCQLEGTNESGFNGVPAGYRNYLGEFISLGLGALWWSATADPQPNFRNIEFDSNELGSNSFDAHSGHSVRCIKDSE